MTTTHQLHQEVDGENCIARLAQKNMADDAEQPLQQPVDNGDDDALASAPDKDKTIKRTKVGIFLLIVIGFLGDTAGPYGTEAAIAAVGPAPIVYLIIFIPLVVTVPLLLQMYELMTLMPSNDGFLRWVSVAFPSTRKKHDDGDPTTTTSNYSYFDGFVPLLSAVFLALTNIVDVSTYSVLSTDYFLRLIVGPSAADTVPFAAQYGIRAAVILLAGTTNYFSLKEQGWISVVMGIAILVPFVIALFIPPFGWMESWIWTDSLPRDKISTADAFSISLWLYSGQLVSSCIAEEAENLSELASSWFWVQPLEIAAYLFPILVALSAMGQNYDWSKFKDGSLVDAFSKVHRTLGICVGVGAVVSNFALFSNCCLFSVRLFAAIADRGWLPKSLLGANRFGSQYKIVTLHIVVALILNLFSFSFIVDNEILLSAVNHFIFLAAFLKMRRHPERAAVEHKIALTGSPEEQVYFASMFPSDWAVALSSMPRIVLYSASAGATLTDWRAAVFLAGCLLLTFALFDMARRQGMFASRRWIDFCSLEVEHKHVAMMPDDEAEEDEENEIRNEGERDRNVAEPAENRGDELRGDQNGVPTEQ